MVVCQHNHSKRESMVGRGGRAYIGDHNVNCGMSIVKPIYMFSCCCVLSDYKFSSIVYKQRKNLEEVVKKLRT